MLSRIEGRTRVPGMESDSAQSTILIVDDDLAILEYAVECWRNMAMPS
jgi:hypothetical protein